MRTGSVFLDTALERVKRRFTLLIDGIGALPYSDRLEALRFKTLAEGRKDEKFDKAVMMFIVMIIDSI